MKKNYYETESVYGPEDYATPFALQRLCNMGEIAPAQFVVDDLGDEFLGSIDTMDPMEFLIALEEWESGEEE